MKTNDLNLMTGHLWWVWENEDESELKTIKNFIQNRENKAPLDKVFGGNIVPKQKDKEEYIIFEARPFYGDEPSFRLFLYDNGTSWGTIEYPINTKTPKEYFKGFYKKTSKNKITVWGIWSERKDFKTPYYILIELSRQK